MNLVGAVKRGGNRSDPMRLTQSLYVYDWKTGVATAWRIVGVIKQERRLDVQMALLAAIHTLRHKQ